jgi:hypothetical protein
MRNFCILLVFLLLVSIMAGCTSRSPTTAIQISDTNIEDVTPVRIGQFDTYTATFRMENPTNVSFNNVEITFTLIPVTSYCHTQTQVVTLPSVAPLEKKTHQFAFSEFADLNCQYTHTYEITSEKMVF